MKKEKQILGSWNTNAQSWVKVLGENSIASRAVTNPAIISAINTHSSGSVLDMGCGEGWLSRALAKNGFKTFGLDATKLLIDAARAQSESLDFACISFEAIVSWSLGKLDSPILEDFEKVPFDAAVFNFCLYEEEGLIDLFSALKRFLKVEGKIFIQTIHPMSMNAMGLEYRSQWLEDAWKGLPAGFIDGHPWYFRTLEEWTAVFEASGLRIDRIYEPTGKGALQPSSVIFVLEKLGFQVESN